MTTECIYNFVKEPQPKSPKKKIYRSRYDPKGPLIGSTFGMHGTNAVNGKGFHELKKNHIINSSLGLPSEAPDPKVYLRKGTRSTKIPLVKQHLVNRNKESYKPPVPSRDDKPVQGLKTDKNYITSNAIEVINSTPKQSRREGIRLHEEYGKVPGYLSSVKAAIEHEKQIVDMYITEQHELTKEEVTQVMDDDERQKLINGLKQRWDDVNSVYQKYCHKVMLDTPGEIKRKASHEAELEQLEEDIEKLSRPGPLLIKT